MKILNLLWFLLLFFDLNAQKFTINGSVKDQNTGENLIGASIYNISSQQGTTSNNYGFYSITLSGNVDLRISYIGYEPVVLKFILKKDTTVNVRLVSGTTLQEVVIRGTAEDKIQESSRMSTIEVPVDQIKALPALLGEVDSYIELIKALFYLWKNEQLLRIKSL